MTGATRTVAALVAAIALLSVLPGVCPCAPMAASDDSGGRHGCCPGEGPQLRAQTDCCSDDAVPVPAASAPAVASAPAASVPLHVDAFVPLPLAQARAARPPAPSPLPILRI